MPSSVYSIYQYITGEYCVILLFKISPAWQETLQWTPSFECTAHSTAWKSSQCKQYIKEMTQWPTHWLTGVYPPPKKLIQWSYLLAAMKNSAVRSPPNWHQLTNSWFEIRLVFEPWKKFLVRTCSCFVPKLTFSHFSRPLLQNLKIKNFRNN